MTFTDLMCPMRRQCGGRGLMALSDGGVPEHGGGLSGGGGGGWGRVGRRLLPPPAGQYGHTVLFAQIPLRPLARLDLPAQDPLLLDHLHHGGVSAQPRHLEHKETSACARPALASHLPPLFVCHTTLIRTPQLVSHVTPTLTVDVQEAGPGAGTGRSGYEHALRMTSSAAGRDGCSSRNAPFVRDVKLLR